MKSKNVGNIKLVSLLFLLGSSSALLLIPAVIQKESYEVQNVKGQNDYVPLEEFDLVSQKYESFKEDYIVQPIENIKEKTNEISQIVQNPIRIISRESEASFSETYPGSNLLSQFNTPDSKITLTEASNKINKQPMIRITKEMVENCKIITEEYNKNGN